MSNSAELPAQARVVIVGGGIIGLEMATVYHALGSEITAKLHWTFRF